MFLSGRQHGRAPKSTYPPALFRVARPGPGRCDLLSPASDPSEVQNGTHEGLKEGNDQRRQVVVSVQPYKNASTDYSERETLKKCMASPVRGRGC